MTKAYADGTLLPAGRGFQFSARPPFDLLDPRYLVSRDPEEVVLAVLQRARSGDFSAFSYLSTLLDNDDDADIWNSAVLLIAYAAPYSFIRSYIARQSTALYERREGHIQEYAALVLGGCCGLWTAPLLLQLMEYVRDPIRHGTMSIHLSFLLEDHNGPIYWGPKSAEDSSQSGWGTDPDYIEQVEMQIKTVEARMAPRDLQRTAVWEGEVFSMRLLVERTLERVRAGQNDERVGTSRLLFEANTGIDCTSFYNEYAQVRPLVASAILEEYLDGGQWKQLEPGARYFFGHRIPD